MPPTNLTAVHAFGVLLLFQLSGEVLARGFGLPLPGPVLGMLLMLALLLRLGHLPAWLAAPSQGLLRHLSLLFVPAGVGLINYLDLLRTAWLPLVVTLLLSTALTMSFAALTLRLLLAVWGEGQGGQGGKGVQDTRGASTQGARAREARRFDTNTQCTMHDAPSQPWRSQVRGVACACAMFVAHWYYTRIKWSAAGGSAPLTLRASRVYLALSAALGLALLALGLPLPVLAQGAAQGIDGRVGALWVYLAQTPLLWLSATVAAYACADWFYRRSGSNPLCNPVLLAVIMLMGLLGLSQTPYRTYFDGAQFVHFLLGPATVALALLLHASAAQLRRMFVPLLLALLISSAGAALAAGLLGQLCGLGAETLRSLLPKSATTPIAMGVAEQIGGLAPLTAALVICTGVIGAMIGSSLLTLLRIREPSVCGFALGLSAHGIGTARALQLGPEAGAFAGLAMGLNGAATALLVPLVARLLGL